MGEGMKKLLIIAAFVTAVLLWKNITPESIATGRAEQARIVHELTNMIR
jgi:hypothetical protein